MKLTAKQLRQIINEEMEGLRLDEGARGGTRFRSAFVIDQLNSAFSQMPGLMSADSVWHPAYTAAVVKWAEAEAKAGRLRGGNHLSQRLIEKWKFRGKGRSPYVLIDLLK